MNQIQVALDRYVQKLRATAQDTTDAREHGELMERLAATQRMQVALAANDLGRLAAELNEEARALGWTLLPGAHGPGAHECFMELQKVTREARLKGRPEAR
jgi:hypothetical protein